MEVGELLACIADMPLQSAAGAKADPSVIAPLLEWTDLMTPELSQRLRVDAKSLRHCGGGHPVLIRHEASLGNSPRLESSS